MALPCLACRMEIVRWCFFKLAWAFVADLPWLIPSCATECWGGTNLTAAMQVHRHDFGLLYHFLHLNCFLWITAFYHLSPKCVQYGSSSACTKPCVGDSTQVCGGGWANSVYTVNSASNVNTFPSGTHIGRTMYWLCINMIDGLITSGFSDSMLVSA